MAKTKSTSSPKAVSKSASRSAKGGTNSSPKSGAVDLPLAISTEQIGEVAGRVWQHLEQEGAQNLAAIKKSTNASNDLVLTAIGWLAREDKLEFSASGRTVKISLR